MCAAFPRSEYYGPLRLLPDHGYRRHLFVVVSASRPDRSPVLTSSACMRATPSTPASGQPSCDSLSGCPHRPSPRCYWLGLLATRISGLAQASLALRPTYLLRDLLAHLSLGLRQVGHPSRRPGSYRDELSIARTGLSPAALKLLSTAHNNIARVPARFLRCPDGERVFLPPCERTVSLRNLVKPTCQGC